MRRSKPSWMDILSERDREVFAAAGYGASSELGRRPVLLVVDMTYEFVGKRELPILKSIQQWPNSCGEEAWSAMRRTQGVIEAARGAQVPVFFSRGVRRGPNSPPLGRWADKNTRTSEWDADTSEIVAEVAPRDEEPVFEKTAPSAFFGTGLVAALVDAGADTVLICGCTTSGCVRATAVDAFSYSFRVGVIEDAVFDRGQIAHKAALCDLAFKYSEVLYSDEAVRYLSDLQDR